MRKWVYIAAVPVLEHDDEEQREKQHDEENHGQHLQHLFHRDFNLQKCLTYWGEKEQHEERSDVLADTQVDWRCLPHNQIYQWQLERTTLI